MYLMHNLLNSTFNLGIAQNYGITVYNFQPKRKICELSGMRTNKLCCKLKSAKY